MAFSEYQPYDHGITRIDTGMVREELAACYLMEDGDEVAIIETGTHYTVPVILKLLQEKNIESEQVKYVIPTHVHLDHAGGVGGLMEKLPNAKAVIHPLGARHLIEPQKLKAGTIAVYGEHGFKNTYGDLIPVEESKVIIGENGLTLSLGSRTLTFIDTPGHARHHFCVHDSLSQGIFTGDTFGISYPNLIGKDRAFIFPTTTPVQFDPEALQTSISKLMALKPKKMYLTHYGELMNPQLYHEELIDQIQHYAEIALACAELTASQGNAKDLSVLIQERLTSFTLSRSETCGVDLSEQELLATIGMDMHLNAQGLAVWINRQTSRNS